MFPTETLENCRWRHRHECGRWPGRGERHRSPLQRVRIEKFRFDWEVEVWWLNLNGKQSFSFESSSSLILYTQYLTTVSKIEMWSPTLTVMYQELHCSINNPPPLKKRHGVNFRKTWFMAIVIHLLTCDWVEFKVHVR